MFSKFWLLVFLAVLMFVESGCNRKPNSPVENGKITISCLIAPIAWIAEKIGGERVIATPLVPDGQSVHAYHPTPQDLVKLQSANYYLQIGLPVEYKTISKLLADSNIKTVDITTAIKRRQIEAKNSCEDCNHDHHNHETDEHEQYTDTHIWLSPPNNLKIAEAICKILVEADPGHREQYQQNLVSFTAEINEIDRNLRRLLAPFRGQTLLVYHPAFGYFADHYGMIQDAIETGGRSPTPKQLENLLNRVKTGNIKVILVQPQFSQHNARAIAQAAEVKVISVDPAHADILETYRQIATALIEHAETN